MKALIVPQAGVLRLGEIDPPEAGPYDALVKIEVCGICTSTDAKLIDGSMFWAPPFPFVLGHESVGTVTRVGAKVRKYRVGDRVTRPLAFWPGSRSGLNVAMGGFAEWGIVRDAEAMADDGDASLKDDYTTQRQLVVPKGLSAMEAALAISLAETASVFLPLPSVRGRKIAVTGTGVAGLAFMLWAKLAGAYVIAVGRRAARLAKALQVGADVAVDTTRGDVAEQLVRAAGGKVDGIIEATGDAVLANSLAGAIASDGQAISYGVPATKGVQYDAAVWRTADVQEHRCYNWVADLLARRWVDPKWFITHDWPLKDFAAAFEQTRKGSVLKGFVRIHE